jgi:ATP-dependent Lon protease
MVVIPGMRTPLVVGREPSLRALEYAKTNNSNMFLATQHDEAVFDPKASEISKFGCVCKVLESIETPDGHFKILVEGIEMAKAVATDDSKGFFFATVLGLDAQGEAAPTTAGSSYAVKA